MKWSGMKWSGLIAGVLTSVVACAASAQDAPAWCSSPVPAATPDSLAVGLAYVPAEYAQKKARLLLAANAFAPVDAALAAELGAPASMVTPHTWLVRAGGFEQPQGNPGPGVEIWYDRAAGLVQVNTRFSSVASDPLNWAVVVVTTGDVKAAQSFCASR